MRRPLGPQASDAILGAMRQVALAGGGGPSWSDTISILAAGRYLLRREGLEDIGTLPAVAPADLVAALGHDRALAEEAIKYLAVMALVDGVLDHAKLARVLEYARALDIEADYLTQLVEAASGHLDWAVADMTRRNFDSILGRSSEGLDPAQWILPYRGARADPALAARYEALGGLPANSFGRALWEFDKTNGYPFPGDPDALNARFATPHDSTHVLSGYDTSPRGEILVSTFTAGMHTLNPMSGHILPVIFNGHLGVKFNEVARSTTGGLDPEGFWNAWARGAATTVDLFGPDWNLWDWVEHDLDDLRGRFGIEPLK